MIPKPEKHKSKSAEDTQKLAKNLASELIPGTVITLSGELGSGKTTFVQGLAKGLGIKSNIISPTFIIVRKYEVSHKQDKRVKNFYHIDLYRIEAVLDLQSLGLKEILQDRESVVAIEWPEKLGELAPDARIQLQFAYTSDSDRTITITKYE